MAVQVQAQGARVGNFPIKNAIVVAPGDLVGLDSNGQIVLADADAIVHAVGFAVFEDGPGVAGVSRTGDAALSQRATVYADGIVQGAKGMSSLTIGTACYLSATAATFTQTPPTGTSDIQLVGTAIAADTVHVRVSQTMLKLQAAGNTTVAFI